MSKPREIDIDSVAALGDRSVEAARIWVTGGRGSTVLIDPAVLEDPRVFGYLMADTMRHAAKAYAAAWPADESKALQAIVDRVGEELREQFNTITPIEGRSH